ncbi:hypothetical protein MRB53_037672 [Persea americana]|nr:hypothetical protein MRB53_037672 [Persea americana]
MQSSLIRSDSSRVLSPLQAPSTRVIALPYSLPSHVSSFFTPALSHISPPSTQQLRLRSLPRPVVLSTLDFASVRPSTRLFAVATSNLAH